MGKSIRIWSEDEIYYVLSIPINEIDINNIAILLNRTKNSVSKKLKRLGIKKSEAPKNSIYSKIDWSLIQDSYDSGLTYRELVKQFHITPQSIAWAKKLNYLKLRSKSDAVRKFLSEGKGNVSKKTGLKRYRQLCEFKFNVYEYPNHFPLDLLKINGWYKAKNNGDNPNGICRDHMISVKYGFINNIDPSIISHPANCKLITHQENVTKNANSSITLSELLERIKNWEIIFNKSN